MDIKELLGSKEIKPKEKTEQLGEALISGKLKVKDLIDFATVAKDSPKATCIEAMEFATRQQPSIATELILNFAVTNLRAKAPRVKWESAKVIGNISAQFPKKLDEAITHLLENTEHPGTVVRWSAAFALGEILKLNTKYNTDLLPAIEAIMQHEEKNSINKIYLAAIKKLKK